MLSRPGAEFDNVFIDRKRCKFPFGVPVIGSASWGYALSSRLTKSFITSFIGRAISSSSKSRSDRIVSSSALLVFLHNSWDVIMHLCGSVQCVVGFPFGFPLRPTIRRGY